MRGGYRVKVGLPEGTGAYPDGTSVILVGAVNEFGSDDGRIPERSFLRAAFRDGKTRLDGIRAELVRAVSEGRRDPVEALELLGTEAASMVQDKILAVRQPPNAPSTVKSKGSSNPLVDTGLLRQSITWEVVE